MDSDEKYIGFGRHPRFNHQIDDTQELVIPSNRKYTPDKPSVTLRIPQIVPTRSKFQYNGETCAHEANKPKKKEDLVDVKTGTRRRHTDRYHEERKVPLEEFRRESGKSHAGVQGSPADNLLVPSTTSKLSQMKKSNSLQVLFRHRSDTGGSSHGRKHDQQLAAGHKPRSAPTTPTDSPLVARKERLIEGLWKHSAKHLGSKSKELEEARSKLQDLEAQPSPAINTAGAERSWLQAGLYSMSMLPFNRALFSRQQKRFDSVMESNEEPEVTEFACKSEKAVAVKAEQALARQSYPPPAGREFFHQRDDNMYVQGGDVLRQTRQRAEKEFAKRDMNFAAPMYL